MISEYLAVSLECDQIFRVSVAVMEDNEYAGFGHVVHDTVVLLTGVLLWRYDHVLLSSGVIPR